METKRQTAAPVVVLGRVMSLAVAIVLAMQSDAVYDQTIFENVRSRWIKM
jgi:hypothetical protein